MLSEEAREALAEVLVDRIEELNAVILTEVGQSINKVGKLTPSSAYKLIQDLKYGDSYTNIVRKLKQVTNLNEREIYKIFEELAKQDQQFAKQFYEYRNVEFIPYAENKELQQQVKALAKITANTFNNMMKTTAFMTIENGKKVYTPLSKIYQKTLDKAVLSLSQGKDSYQTAMRKAMKELADSGIRTVDYSTGYSRRLDSAVRQNMLDGMRQLSNEVQRQFGEEFDADGIEISVHEHPAPDHEDIQGHQYSIEEFEELNNSLERPISTLNCYHYTFSIVLGVSQPEYTQEQLDKINADNKAGFEFEGKHYTMYEGTQLQRQIETKIRQLKDRQIGARAMEDMEEVGKYQRKITQLTQKYNDLCKISGLQPKKTRMQVQRI